MARGIRGGGHAISRLTHQFPGEHYLVVRPIRDDLRRSVVEVPRRGRRARSRSRRREERKVGKRLNKQLTRDTHKGKATNQSKPATTRRAPTTQKAQQPGFAGMKVHHAPRTAQVRKSTGVKVHRPRLLSPRAHPRLYHVLPVRRIYDHIVR